MGIYMGDLTLGTILHCMVSASFSCFLWLVKEAREKQFLAHQTPRRGPTVVPPTLRLEQLRTVVESGVDHHAGHSQAGADAY